MYYVRLCLLCICFIGTTAVFAQINTPAGAIIPFGSNTSYEFGIMPTNLPTSGSYGKSTDAATFYNTWKTNYVAACPNGQFRVRFDDPNHTVSEGIAYGMILAAYAADKALFDGLWAYYKTNSSGGLMHWRINGCNNVYQTGAATDAELDAAFALLVAETQWPTATSPYDYQAEVGPFLGQIKGAEMDPNNYQASNGNQWGFDADCRNPSYQSPGYYKLYADVPGQDATFWRTNAVNAAYSLITNNDDNTTGLVSDWCNKAGQPNACQSNSQQHYGYDACRNPWRMASDVIWFNDSRAISQCVKVANYVQSRGASTVGGPVPQSGGTGIHNATFVSTFAAGIMGSTSHQLLLNSMYSETVNVNDATYFGNTLRAVCMFMMTGNFWKPGTSLTPEINVRQGTTNIATGSTVNLGNVMQGSSESFTFTIQNLGAQTLNISSVTVTGTDASKFTIGSAPTSLSASSSDDFTVTFTPGSGVTGTFSVTLNIDNNDPNGNEDPYQVNLTVTATQNATSPEIEIRHNGDVITSNSSAYNLGHITQSARGYYTLTIANTGDGPLSVSNVTLAGTGFSPYGTNPTMIAAGDTATVIISVLAGSTSGTMNGSVTISNDDSDEGSYTVNLTLSVSPCATTLSNSGILQDYEENNNVAYYIVNNYPSLPKGPWNASATNPEPSNVNNSPIVASLTRRLADEEWDQIRYIPCGSSNFNVVDNDYISILVYSPRPGVVVKLSGKRSDGATPVNEDYSSDIDMLTTKTGEWEKLYFDLSPLTSVTANPDVAMFDIMIDPQLLAMADAGATEMVYYIDEIRYDAPPCPAKPTVSAGGITTFCEGGSVTLTATSSASGATYVWNKDDAPILTATTATYSATTSGQYSVTATAEGCELISDAIPVTVNPKPAVPTITAESSTSICEGESLTLTAATSTTGVTYQWEKDGVALNAATSETYLASEAGSYTVTATAGICSSTSAATEITVTPKPATPTVSADGALTFCEGESLTLSGSSATTGASYQWNNSGTEINGATSATLEVTESGAYNLIATSGSCSSSSDTFDVVVNPIPAVPTITADGSLSFCEGESVILTANTSSEGVTFQWNANELPIQSATSTTYTVTESGSYTVLVKNGTCSSVSAATEVTVSPMPAIPAITSDGSLTFCEGDNVTLTGSSSTGAALQWQNNATDIEGAVSETYSATESGTYTLTATIGACTSTSEGQEVLVNPIPAVPSISATGETTVCEGESVTLTGSSTTSGVSYQWNLNDSPIAGEITELYVATETGTYTVTAIQAGCSATSEGIFVAVDAIPPAPSIAADGELISCEKDSLMLTGSTNFPEVDFQWYNNGLAIPGAVNNIIYPRESGVYTLAVLSANCHSNSEPIEVTVKPTPVLTLSPSSEICIGGSTDLAAVANGGTGFVYEWSPAASLSSSTTATTTASPENTTTYSLVVTNAEGCLSDTGKVTISVISGGEASVSIQASPAEVVCEGTTVKFTAIPVNGGTPTFQWLINDVAAEETTSSFTPLTLSDNDRIQAVMTSGITCVTGSPATSNLITMTVNQAPVVSITNQDQEICSGSSVLLNTAVSSGTEPYTYSWTPAGGLSSSTEANPTASPESTTTYSVTVTDANGCSANSGSVTVLVNETPVITASADPADICLGSTTTLTAIAAGGTEPLTYSWTPATSLSSASDASTTASPETNTTYSVVATNGEGCSSTSAEVTITVNTGDAAGVSITASPSEAICEGELVTFTATPVNGGTPSYEWKVNGATVGDNSATYTSSSVSDNDEVQVVMTSGISCVTGSPAESNIIAMTVTESPVLATNSADQILCSGSSAVLSTVVTGGTGTATYEWSPAEGLSSTTDANPTANPTVTTIYSVFSTDANGCTSNTESVSVVVVENPSATASTSDSEVCLGSSATLSATGSAGTAPYIFTWSPAESLSSASAESPTATPQVSTAYSVIVTDINGCSSEPAAVTVDVAAPAEASVTISATGPSCAQHHVTYVANPTSGGDNPSYQWQVNGANAGTNSSNYTTSSFAGSAITCIMTSSLECVTGSPATSNAVTVTPVGTSPCTSPNQQTIDGPATVDAGQTGVTYSVSPPADGSVYSWSIPAGSVITSASEDSSSITITFGTTSGNVVLTETNMFGNTSSTVGVTVVPASGTTSQILSQGVIVSPNPSVKSFNINLNEAFRGTITFRVRNALGEVVYTEVASKASGVSDHLIDLKNVAGGVYFLEIESAEGTALKRLVKQ